MDRPKREKKPSVYVIENKEYENELLKSKKRKTQPVVKVSHKLNFIIISILIGLQRMKEKIKRIVPEMLEP
jgi:hypothetical protein